MTGPKLASKNEPMPVADRGHHAVGDGVVLHGSVVEGVDLPDARRLGMGAIKMSVEGDLVVHDDAVSWAENEVEDALSAVERVKVGGLPIAVLDRDATAELTISTAMANRRQHRSPLLFTTINGQVASLCSRWDVRRLFEQADLISADGMSAVIASRIVCPTKLPERVSTTDAFHDAAKVAVREGATFYLLGASEAINRRAVERALELYPGLKIVGRRNGYFNDAEEAEVVEEIARLKPDVLWLGLGVPKQQAFAVRNRDKLTGVGLVKTCGGLFDFLSGAHRRAPRWMQALGLEWFHRVLAEPKRLGWRYLTTNPHALYLLMTRSGGHRSKITAALPSQQAYPGDLAPQ